MVNCNKYIALVEDFDNRGGYECVGREGVREIYTFCSILL